MLEILSIVLPIFLVLLTGNLLKKMRLLEDGFIHAANQLIFYFFLPVLLFYKTAQSELGDILSITTVMIMISTIILIMLFSLAIGGMINFPKKYSVTFAASNFRANYAYLGFPVCFYAYGDQALSIASILMAFVVPPTNILSVLSFSINNPGELKNRAFLKDTLASPLVIACLAGIAFSASGMQLPIYLDRTLSMLSGVTLPLALMAIGATINLKDMKGNWVILALSVMIKLFIMPMTAMLILYILNIPLGLTEKVMLLLLASPSATVNYILAGSLQGDEELASAIIVTTTTFSILSFILWLNFLQ